GGAPADGGRPLLLTTPRQDRHDVLTDGPHALNAPATADGARHHCRNPHCRCRLAEPVDNLRRAFCCRGCRESFYRRRCLVCEKSLAHERLKTCCRRCRLEFRRFPHRFQQAKAGVAKTVKTASETPVNRAFERALLDTARRANVAIFAAASKKAIF